MTTLYKNRVDEHFERELERLGNRMFQEGNTIVDTSYINSFFSQRIGLTSCVMRGFFYNEIMDQMESRSGEGTVSFPRETGMEYDRYLQNREKTLNKRREDGAPSEELHLYEQSMEAMREFKTFVLGYPSEQLITPALEIYRPRIRAALEEVAGRPGVVRDHRAIYGGVPGREEHKGNDMNIVTTAILVGLSNEQKMARILTRDSGIRDVCFELQNADDRGLYALSHKYDFPCHSGFVRQIKIVYDSPLSDKTLERIKLYMSAHSDHQEIERKRAANHRHGKKQITRKTID